MRTGKLSGLWLVTALRDNERNPFDTAPRRSWLNHAALQAIDAERNRKKGG